MVIHFFAEMKIESKNYNIPIFIYSKIEEKKFNTNLLLFISHSNYKKTKQEIYFLWFLFSSLLIWLMVNIH